MNTRQITITVLCVLLGVSLGWAWALKDIQEVKPDNETLQHQQFIASQISAADVLESKFGIPMSVSVTVAAMVTDFGENDELASNHAYFLLLVDSTSVSADTVWVGSVPIRAYPSTIKAYLGWAQELRKQYFYTLVKGKPASEWAPYMEKWGYGIADMYEAFPELGAIDTIYNNSSKID
jgi:hypothetical protein